MTEHIEADWVSRFADQVINEAEQRAPGKPIICASGLSPSGPIHLGNLREVMVPHLVADEIQRRGHACIHLLSWDDYDRFRKVPAGIDQTWEQHIGKPLTAVPAPEGSQYANWAEHFKAPMITALAALGVEYRGISQTEQYTSGAYREQILLAMRERNRIDAILERYRTKKKVAAKAKVAAAEEAALTGSGAADEADGGTSAGYFPYKPYCSVCNRDLTTVTAYNDDTTALSYTCTCGHQETVYLTEHSQGKLVWKVDWPMRWAYEGVVFEPSGVDHNSPGSSFVVGGHIIEEVFGGTQPIGPMYAFVGISGMSKMSSSKGEVPTPLDALQIMEAPLVRWLYARRKPQQSFTISFDQEVQRLYDEWDSLARKVAGNSASPADMAAYNRSVRTAERELPSTARPLAFRMLASIVDITTGQDEQILRIVQDADPEKPVSSLDEIRPRLDCAAHWVSTSVPTEQRTQVRTEPAIDMLKNLSDEEQQALRLLADGLDNHWSLEGLTKLVYGIPKTMANLPLDTPPTPELKVAQRKFFSLLYILLVGKETGPRLPTLLLAIGADRVRKLVTV